jgi:hypothetical protein
MDVYLEKLNILLFRSEPGTLRRLEGSPGFALLIITVCNPFALIDLQNKPKHS